MNKYEQLIVALVLEKTVEMPLKQRAQYIHALANLCSSDALVDDFARLANDLDAADERQGKLLSIVRTGPGGHA